MLGLGLGLLLALGLISLMRSIDFPVGDLELTPIAPVAAVVTGLLTAGLGALNPARAGRPHRPDPRRARLRGDPRAGPRRAARSSASR